jgi:hypothetical protein
MNFLEKLFRIRKTKHYEYEQTTLQELPTRMIFVVHEITAVPNSNLKEYIVGDFLRNLDNSNRKTLKYFKFTSTEVFEKGETYCIEETTPGNKTIRLASVICV